MEIYQTKLEPSAVTTVAGASSTRETSTIASTCSSGELATSGNYALPLERIWYDQHPEWFTKPHHDYHAADIPVFAAAAGVVVSTTTGGSCGFGVVINGNDGAQYTYCHGLPGSRAVATGDNVLTGQRLMSSASTGNSTGPHLHFGIRINGQDRCPQPFLVAIAEGHPLDRHRLPSSGCTY
jgi:murein DD-endopeptidase MepM/ murein hydrolase activator NlpD